MKKKEAARGQLDEAGYNRKDNEALTRAEWLDRLHDDKELQRDAKAVLVNVAGINGDECHVHATAPDMLMQQLATKQETEELNDCVVCSLNRTNRTPNARARDIWIPRFLKNLEKCPVVSIAARLSGIHHSTPADRAEHDPEFAQAMKEAMNAGIDLVEAAAFKSAVHGDVKPILHEGIKVGEVVEYSDKMRALLLSGRRPEIYGNNHKHEITGKIELASPAQVREIAVTILPWLQTVMNPQQQPKTLPAKVVKS